MTVPDDIAEALEVGVEDGTELTAQQQLGVTRVRAVLADETVWTEPPAGLFDGIAQEVEREPAPVLTPVQPPQAPALQTTVARPFPAPTPLSTIEDPPDTNVVPLWRSTKKRLIAALAAAALIGILCGTAAGIALRRPQPSSLEVVMRGTERVPGAAGTATVTDTPTGLKIELDVSGLPPAGPGTYYEGWLKGDGGLVAIGTFHFREGHIREGMDTVVLWSGVGLDQYPTMTITLQAEGAGPASSGDVIMIGTLAGP